MMRSTRGIGAIAAVVLLAPLAVSAQTIGTFRWQTQPFCNLVTVTISIAGPAFRLEGTDDHCGAPAIASVIGMAFPNADGSIGVGLTIVSPGAAVLHLDATVLLNAGFNGTWRDTVGRTGNWTFTTGGSTGGPLRPVVGPLLPYGGSVTQPAGAGDRGVSAIVTTDVGPPNDAAGVYGRFGTPLSIGSAAPAGVRGDSGANVGVYGLSDSGFGVAGGAQTGVGVQGYGVGAASIGVQAVSLSGGTALNIHNGAITVSGGVRAAFVQTFPGGTGCSNIDHPLLNGDPNAMVFTGSQNQATGTFAFYGTTLGRWQVCFNSLVPAGSRMSILVIKQAP